MKPFQGSYSCILLDLILQKSEKVLIFQLSVQWIVNLSENKMVFNNEKRY